MTSPDIARAVGKPGLVEDQVEVREYTVVDPTI
jgi:hypothetical protein